MSQSAPLPPAVRSGRPPRAEAVIRAYFVRRGWKPFPFQREVWAAMRAGRSGLLHATTGAGKTLAVGFGAWLAARPASRPQARTPRSRSSGSRRCARSPPTPRARWRPSSPRSGRWSVGLRTGDTDDKTRAAQRKRLPRAARHHARKPHAHARPPRARARASPRSTWSSSTNGTSFSATSAACRRSLRSRASAAGARTR